MGLEEEKREGRGEERERDEVGRKKGEKREGWLKGKKRGRGAWKVTFWNVAGLGNKDADFWRGIREWDVVVLLETWIREKSWDKLK